MKQKLILIFAIIIVAKLSHSQIIDKYGFNVGITNSTQKWDYKLLKFKPDTRYKFGFQAFLQAEKDLVNFLALRTEVGYVQKGFINKEILHVRDGSYYIPARQISRDVIFHDLAFNIGLKVKPLRDVFYPYLLVGLRTDYMIAYKDAKFEDPNTGEILPLYECFIKEFNKFNFGGLIGFGMDIKDLIYFEFEFNPNFTKNCDDDSWSIKDNCRGFKIGLNINKLIK